MLIIRNLNLISVQSWTCMAVSFPSCVEFYLYTEYYELFYIETRIVLLHL